MNRRRGFSIIDVVLATAITAILCGAMTSLYLFSSTRSAHAITTDAATNQAQQVSDFMDKVISDSVSATVVTSGAQTGLKCTLPANGTDTNGDGIPDQFTPVSITNGVVKWGTGTRVWFYMSNTTGNFTSVGTILTMAIRNDDLLPTGVQRNAAFTFYYDSGKPRWNLVDSVTWAANATNGTAGYTIKTSSLVRSDSAATSAYTTDKAVSRTANISRTVDLNKRP